MVEVLARTQDWPLVSQWDQTLERHQDHARRVELAGVLRERWQRVEALKPYLEPLGGILVRAQLAQRQWRTALPLAVDLARKAVTEGDRRERLRWILVAGNQALEDGKPQEVLAVLGLKELEDMLTTARELGPEFADLRRRAAGPPGN